MLYQEIPSLDLSDFTSENEQTRNNFVKALGDAYQNIGFVAIKNHGLTDEMTSRLYRAIKTFFALPESIKQQYEIPELAVKEEVLVI